jgi:hypothetical protein
MHMMNFIRICANESCSFQNKNAERCVFAGTFALERASSLL